MRGADLLVATLAAAGVERIFTLSGNQIMPVFDACLDARIALTHTRHEAAAVFMADAWAQLTGRIGVCLVTAAPGAANAVGPLFSARHSESPVLLLTGDSPLGQDGRGAFQELDQVSMFAGLCKSSRRLDKPGQLAGLVAESIRLALSGRPGPVHLALPFDLLQAQQAVAAPPAGAFEREAHPLSAHDLQDVAQRLARAQKPLVLLGPSMNRMRSPVSHAALARSLDAPVIALESPRGLSDPSLGAFRHALRQADLVLCLGKSVNFTLGFGGAEHRAAGSGWILIDADQPEHDRARRNLGDALELTLVADPRDAATGLLEACAGGSARADWCRQVSDMLAARCLPQEPGNATGGVAPAVLAAAVQKQLDAATDPVLICDGGEFGQWAQAGTQTLRRIINGPSGAIGGSLAYAIAASQAQAGSLVIAMMGDGTAGFHFAEFETAVRERTPLVVVIGNDACWNAEHQIQLREYGADRLTGCQLSAARYDLAVAALGGHGEYVTHVDQLDDALRRAIDSGLPACVNVVLESLAAPAVPEYT